MKRFNGKRGKTKNKYVCWTKLKFHGCVRANGHRHTYTGTVFFEVSTEGIPKLKSNYGSFEEQLIIQIVKRKKVREETNEVDYWTKQNGRFDPGTRRSGDYYCEG